MCENGHLLQELAPPASRRRLFMTMPYMQRFPDMTFAMYDTCCESVKRELFGADIPL